VRLVEQRDRRRDARELVAAHAEPEDDIRTIDVGELCPLGQPARLLQELDRLANLTGLLEGPRLAGKGANQKRSRAGLLDGGSHRAEGLDRLRVLVCGRQRLCSLELRFDLRPLLRRHTGREVRRIDTELVGQPRDRRLRRAGLAALDLADVLLREAIARELCLRQPRGHAEQTDALAEASTRCRRRRHGGRVHAHFSQVGFGPCAVPLPGDVRLPRLGQLTVSEIT
jgi:hypothetical protein